MNKRIMALLLTVCMATTMLVSLTACGKDTKDETSSSITSMDEVRKTMLKDVDSLVKLGDYKSIAVSVAKETVTDTDIQSYIDYDLQQHGTPQQIKEGTVADGDSINIDYVGRIDGTEFEGGSGEGTDLTIGSNSFIDGFETSLIGAPIGQVKVINVNFPADYDNEDVAGKAAEFTVTINYKNGENIPATLNDEFVASLSLGDEVKNVDQYKEYVKATLDEEAEATQDNLDFNAIVESLIDICEVSGYHDDLSQDTLYEEEIAYMEQYAESYEYSYDEFVAMYTGMSAEDYEASLKTDIEKYVKRIMIYRAIAKAESIEVSQEDYEAEVAEYSSNYENYNCENVEDFEKQYSAQIYEYLIYDKVETLLKDNSSVTYTDATEAPSSTPEVTAAP